MHYGADAPAAWYDIPEAERAARTVLTGDQCIIDDPVLLRLRQPRTAGAGRVGVVLVERVGVAECGQLRTID